MHHPEFKDPETFMRSIDPVFVKPKNGGAAKAATPNKGRGKKKGRGNNKKKGGKGFAKDAAGKGQLSTKENAKSMTFPCKAEPPSGNTPPSSEGRGGGGGQPCFGAPKRTVQLHLDGTLKWESQNTCPFCRSPKLAGSDLVAALLRRIDNLNCDQSHFELGGNYYDGANGCEKSLKKAREFWEKSARGGEHDGSLQFGHVLYTERGGLEGTGLQRGYERE